MRRGWWVVALCAMGCVDTPGPATDAGVLPDPSAGIAEHLARCAQHVPASVRAGALAGWEELTPPSIVGATLSVCAFRRPRAPARITLAFECGAQPSDGQLERMKDALIDHGGTDLPGLGRAAVRATPKLGSEVEQITAWSRSGPCSVTATWLGEGREATQELVRLLLEDAPGPVTLDGGAAPSPDGG